MPTMYRCFKRHTVQSNQWLGPTRRPQMTLFRSIRLGIAVLGVTVAASALGGAAPTAEAAGLIIVPRKPDVAVKAVGHSGGISDSFMTVGFDVTNKYQPANNVQLKSE